MEQAVAALAARGDALAKNEPSRWNDYVLVSRINSPAACRARRVPCRWIDFDIDGCTVCGHAAGRPRKDGRRMVKAVLPFLSDRWRDARLSAHLRMGWLGCDSEFDGNAPGPLRFSA
jgi:hypothetical protein